MQTETQVEKNGRGIPHPYHLVKPSPWPIVGALAGGFLAVSALLYLHSGYKWVIVLGVLGVLGVMVVWWRDVILESVHTQDHTPVVKIGLRYGMVLFIASEVMFFVAFFWAFYNASLFPQSLGIDLMDLTEEMDFTESVVGESLEAAANPQGLWPPPNIQVIEAFGLPFTMTLTLLLSGCTVTWAHHALLQDQKQEAQRALGITILLGVLFLILQIYEYTHAHFGFREGIYPSTFYMATGFHGFHVLIGVVFLSICLGRTIRGHFSAKSHFGFEAAAWYWHFVDVVWLFLFTSIYWWGGLSR